MKKIIFAALLFLMTGLTTYSQLWSSAVDSALGTGSFVIQEINLNGAFEKPVIGVFSASLTGLDSIYAMVSSDKSDSTYSQVRLKSLLTNTEATKITSTNLVASKYYLFEVNDPAPGYLKIVVVTSGSFTLSSYIKALRHKSF